MKPRTCERVMVIGLDCAPPALVFERYRHRLPHLDRLMRSGSWGPLRTTQPPITVPAWASMVSGRDPGELGLYGFRLREPGSYRQRIVNAHDVPAPRLWDWLGRAGKSVSVLFVPPTYPPSEVHGEMVSCLLTPDADCPHTYPARLQAELRERFGPYRMDVEGFRSQDRARVLEQIFAMTRQHFAVARYLWRTRAPDFLMLVEMGPDRLHHAFWPCFDPAHPAFAVDGPYRDVAERYYAYLDECVGGLVSLADERTAVLVVSDHGAQPLLGAVCLNEWLMQEGYLVLLEPPERPTPLAGLKVDWSRTRAWAEGGYYGRVYLNLRGREPHGPIAPEHYERERALLADRLRAVPQPGAGVVGADVVLPSQAYRQVSGLPPDLLVFFENLAYRCIGSLGMRCIVTRDNDRGRDGCNHAWEGIWILAGAGTQQRGRIEGLEIYDVAPTVSALLGVAAPDGILGKDRS
ncbi:MAG: alkaline phosphatase family protein [Proteobacteria bacterium]|nr:alkaline phosphatase family protein [Pseudomonadota bacterium]